MKEELTKLIKFPCTSENTRKLMERSYLREEMGFRPMIYIDEVLDLDVDGIIKLKKNRTYELRLPREYDLLYDFRFTYDKLSMKDYGIIKELPDEINDLIKEFLVNKVDIHLNTGLKNVAEAKKQFTYIGGLIHKTFHFNLKECSNNHENFKTVVNNKLPIVACAYSDLLLKIKSKQDCDLKIKLRCALTETNLRCQLAQASYLYDNIVIMRGVLGKATF